ncbi:hypothetical protein HYT45_01445 [Candidatus Uhrbacteria bacterium]|nr:hypothetical protein [Candidatus Uhrbacteria bacterium]
MSKFRLFFAMLLFSFSIVSCGGTALRTTADYTTFAYVEVNYSQRIQNLVYGRVDNRIRMTASQDVVQAPSTGRQDLHQVILMHFGDESDNLITAERVEYEMRFLGLRPATALETLNFVNHSPYLLRELSIVAMGTYWRDLRNYPYVMVLSRHGGERAIELWDLTEEFPLEYRFLAVPVQQEE